MNEEVIGEKIDLLDFAIWETFYELIELVYDTWNRAQEHMNAGQAIIFIYHIIPKLDECAENIEGTWPLDTDLERDYRQPLLYDIQVADADLMTRAFYNTIYRHADKMERLQARAVVLQFLQYMLDFLGMFM